MSEETKAKVRETLLARYGSTAPHENPFSRVKHGRRSDLGNQYFRSAWEANFARYLNWLVRKHRIKGWKYEAVTFRFEEVKRGPYTYTPDFQVETLDGGVVYHEVKGWMTPRSRSQTKRMAKYHPLINLYIVDKDEYAHIKALGKSYSTFWE